MSATPYNYYATPTSAPRLCEIDDGYVYFIDGDRPTRVVMWDGTFVPLIEQPAALHALPDFTPPALATEGDG